MPTISPKEQALVPDSHQDNSIRKEGEFSPRLTQIMADLKESGVFPITVIQGGGALQVDINFYSGDSVEQTKRPFTVLKVTDIGEDSLDNSMIYKLGPEKGDKSGSRNEVIFLRDVAPSVHANLDEPTKVSVDLPKVYHSRVDQDQPNFVIEEEFKGEITGGIHESRPEILNEDDLQTLTNFIDQFNKNTDDGLLSQSGLNISEVQAYDRYKEKSEHWSGTLFSSFGFDYVQKLKELLESAKTKFEAQPMRINNGDINTSNIIKQENGKLGLYDWEKILKINDPSADYAFLFANLWNQPELQEKFLTMAIENNKQDENFQELFRVGFACYRGLGELDYWINRRKNAETSEEETNADNAVIRLSGLVKDAIDGVGIWAKS